MCVCVCAFPQVFLGPNGEVEEYSVISIQPNSAISSDLILDQREEHLFIMTPNMVDATHSHCAPGAPSCSSVQRCRSCIVATKLLKNHLDSECFCPNSLFQ